MYQIFHQQINIDSSLLFTFSLTSSTRGHNYKLYKPFACLKARSDFFVVQKSTLLPYIVVNTTSVSILKNKLDEHWNDMLYSHSS